MSSLLILSIECRHGLPLFRLSSNITCIVHCVEFGQLAESS